MTRGWGIVVKILLFVFFVSAITGAVYFYLQYQKAAKGEINEAENLTKIISKLIDLPANEVPAVATVSDKAKLQNFSFFEKAENGDKVLIYTQAKKAILYRPSLGKIIDVGPVKTTSPEQQTSPETTPTPTVTSIPSPVNNVDQEGPAKLVLYNGTDTAGLTHTIGWTLLKEIENVEIIDKLPAVKKTYQKTLVIDLSKTRLGAVNALVNFLDAQASTLPKEEVWPEGADILIILGADRE